MITRRLFAAGAAALLPRPALAARSFEVTRTDAEWRARLTPAQYAVLRQDVTEPPFSSPLLHEKRKGVFACAGCEQDLFPSGAKYDSRTGWPSFWRPAARRAVFTLRDTSEGMDRTAVACTRCGGHLGHVFTDGPKPTGLRYCINGLALTFRPTAA